MRRRGDLVAECCKDAYVFLKKTFVVPTWRFSALSKQAKILINTNCFGLLGYFAVVPLSQQMCWGLEELLQPNLRWLEMTMSWAGDPLPQEAVPWCLGHGVLDAGWLWEQKGSQWGSTLEEAQEIWETLVPLTCRHSNEAEENKTKNHMLFIVIFFSFDWISWITKTILKREVMAFIRLTVMIPGKQKKPLCTWKLVCFSSWIGLTKAPHAPAVPLLAYAINVMLLMCCSTLHGSRVVPPDEGWCSRLMKTDRENETGTRSDMSLVNVLIEAFIYNLSKQRILFKNLLNVYLKLELLIFTLFRL